MQPLGIKFLPCSTGAPWSNGAAERAVQTIKQGARKFAQQEHAQHKWDEYLHFFSSTHNKSTSIYGYAPEELQFGFSNPAPNDLFQLWPDTSDPQDYINVVVEKATENRRLARLQQEKIMKRNLTYRNKGLQKKVFKPGEIVLQRQLQFATGPGKAMQPKYQGPYVVIAIDKDLSSALIEHMHTNVQVRSHFTNMTHLNYCPQYHKYPDRYDEQFLQFLPEKYSKDKYYSSKTKYSESNSETVDLNSDANSEKVNFDANSDYQDYLDVVSQMETKQSAQTVPEMSPPKKTNPYLAEQKADIVDQLAAIKRPILICPDVSNYQKQKMLSMQQTAEQRHRTCNVEGVVKKGGKLDQKEMLVTDFQSEKGQKAKDDIQPIENEFRRSSRHKKPPDKLNL
jgi:hypothetical protein